MKRKSYQKNSIAYKIRANFNEVTKAEIDRVKNKLAKIFAKKPKVQQSEAERVGMNLAKRIINIFSTWRKETTEKST